MRISLTIVIILLLTNSIMANDNDAPRRPVDFFAEEITLAVDDGFVTIAGIYHFRNNTAHEGNYPIMFPFYVDSLSSFPDKIEGSLIGTDTATLNIREMADRNGAMIDIPLMPNAVTIWRLDYRQRITGNSARYILKSTQSWGQPLEEATYKFVIPSHFADVRTWPEADSIAEESGLCKFWAHRKDFMPLEDMTINWTSKNETGMR